MAEVGPAAPQRDPPAAGIVIAAEVAAYCTGSSPFASGPRGKDVEVAAQLKQPHHV